MIGMMWLLRNPAVSASIHLKMMNYASRQIPSLYQFE